MNKIYILIIIVLIILTNNVAANDSCLNFKKVIDNNRLKIDSNYMYGKDIYPRYKFQGLSENFLIRIEPNISIPSSKIESVKVIKIDNKQIKYNQYMIIIKFSYDISEKIFKYTNENINQKIAIEINGNIFNIFTIFTPVREEMRIGIVNQSLDDIIQILSNICDEICIKVKAAPWGS